MMFEQKKTFMQKLFDMLHNKFGSNECKNLIEEQADSLEELNSYLKTLGEYAKNSGLNIIMDNENHRSVDFQGKVFVIGTKSSMVNCNVDDAIHISPMAKQNIFNCITFFKKDAK